MSWLPVLWLTCNPPVELEPAFETFGIMAGATLGCICSSVSLLGGYRASTLFLMVYLDHTTISSMKSHYRGIPKFVCV